MSYQAQIQDYLPGEGTYLPISKLIPSVSYYNVMSFIYFFFCFFVFCIIYTIFQQVTMLFFSKFEDETAKRLKKLLICLMKGSMLQKGLILSPWDLDFLDVMGAMSISHPVNPVSLSFQMHVFKIHTQICLQHSTIEINLILIS